MKSLILMTILGLSSNVFSAEYLVKLTRASGFSPIARSSQLIISEDGKITSVVNVQSKITKSAVGTLSAKALANLKDTIERIADDAVLVDLDAKRPQCADAPGRRVEINKGGKTLIVSAVRNCHKYEVAGADANNLSKLAESLDSIAH